MIEKRVVRAWLSLGSNVDPRRQIGDALSALRQRFGELVISPIYESQAVGFNGDNFHNLVVGIETELQASELVRVLRQIETAQGRVRGREKFAPRPLDIDLLTYGDCIIDEDGVQVPREEILRYAFVLLPLSEVAPNERHPIDGRTYRQLWAGFDATGQSLWRVQEASGARAPDVPSVESELSRAGE
ncbi:MAG: 2-amino-4-hydroxy-6-hydroxymethyldihydropteridine diphosphokinase [Candidatus Thiodiazotropha sp.]